MGCNQGIFKFFELVFLVTIIFLARFGYRGYTILFGYTVDRVIFAYIVLPLFLIYIPSYTLGQWLGDSRRPAWRTDLLFSLVGTILFLAVGADIVQTHRLKTPSLWKYDTYTSDDVKTVEDFEQRLQLNERIIIVKGSNFFLEDYFEDWFNFVTNRFSFINGGKALGALCIILGFLFCLDGICLIIRKIKKKSDGSKRPLRIRVRHPEQTQERRTPDYVEYPQPQKYEEGSRAPSRLRSEVRPPSRSPARYSTQERRSASRDHPEYRRYPAPDYDDQRGGGQDRRESSRSPPPDYREHDRRHRADSRSPPRGYYSEEGRGGRRTPQQHYDSDPTLNYEFEEPRQSRRGRTGRAVLNDLSSLDRRDKERVNRGYNYSEREF